ncbi:MAG: phosphotransferase [Candidatus Melainabacteria bacterium]|nr:phosphotransferase [Candidatus Melainabacteria bacterium]
MREGWNRATALIELSNKEVEALLHPILPDVKVTSVEPTHGGLANTNLKICIAGDEEPLLLRFCIRDPNSVAKEFRLLELVEGTVPVPFVCHFSRDNPVNGHPYILMQWVEGKRLETVVDTLEASEIADLGESLGKTLAGIHSFHFEHQGFFDENLNVGNPLEMGGKGLLSYVRECLSNPIIDQRIDAQLAKRILVFLERESSLLDEWDGSPCLTHCDFNGSNILVNKNADRWQVAAVLDWEFAISGTPFFDFGNLLRVPVGALPGIEDSVEKGYKNGGGELPKEWRKMSDLTDLTAWMEFLTRESAGPQLISDALAQIVKTIAEG